MSAALLYVIHVCIHAFDVTLSLLYCGMQWWDSVGSSNCGWRLDSKHSSERKTSQKSASCPHKKINGFNSRATIKATTSHSFYVVKATIMRFSTLMPIRPVPFLWLSWARTTVLVMSQMLVKLECSSFRLLSISFFPVRTRVMRVLSLVATWELAIQVNSVRKALTRHTKSSLSTGLANECDYSTWSEKPTDDVVLCFMSWQITFRSWYLETLCKAFCGRKCG